MSTIPTAIEEECKMAFDAIKELLRNPLVLVAPIQRKRFQSEALITTVEEIRLVKRPINAIVIMCIRGSL